MDSRWRCPRCGPVAGWHVSRRVDAEIMAGVAARARTSGGAGQELPAEFVDLVAPEEHVPLWCPWPLPVGWTVTGVGWAGDDRTGVRATAVALSGPAPLQSGPADIVFVAEQPGVGLGAGLAGLRGIDPGPGLRDAVVTTAPHAKIRADGHPTPLWAVPAGPGRSLYVGEARAIWLYVVAWPPAAGYLLADGIILHDCVDSLPGELVYGVPTARLKPGRSINTPDEFGRTD
jgi:hypothetical protein